MVPGGILCPPGEDQAKVGWRCFGSVQVLPKKPRQAVPAMKTLQTKGEVVLKAKINVLAWF